MRNGGPERFRAAAFSMGRVGIEPTTLGLKVPCSATELPARTKLNERQEQG